MDSVSQTQAETQVVESVAGLKRKPDEQNEVDYPSGREKRSRNESIPEATTTSIAGISIGGIPLDVIPMITNGIIANANMSGNVDNKSSEMEADAPSIVADGIPTLAKAPDVPTRAADNEIEDEEEKPCPLPSVKLLTPPVNEMDWAGRFKGSPNGLMQVKLENIIPLPKGRGSMTFALQAILSFNGGLYIKDEYEPVHMGVNNVGWCDLEEVDCPPMIWIRDRVGTNRIFKSMCDLIRKGYLVRVMKCVSQDLLSDHKKFKNAHGFFPFRLLFSFARKLGNRNRESEFKIFEANEVNEGREKQIRGPRGPYGPRRKIAATPTITTTRPPMTRQKVKLPPKYATSEMIGQPVKTSNLQNWLLAVQNKMKQDMYDEWEATQMKSLQTSLKEFLNLHLF